jgi:hypothetical protein
MHTSVLRPTGLSDMGATVAVNRLGYASEQVSG